MNQILTTPEVAALLKCHYSTVYRMIHRGEIPYFKVGSDFRFREDLLAEWLNGQNLEQARR